MSMCNTDDYSKAELRSYISDYIPDQMIDLKLLSRLQARYHDASLTNVLSSCHTMGQL